MKLNRTFFAVLFVSLTLSLISLPNPSAYSDPPGWKKEHKYQHEDAQIMSDKAKHDAEERAHKAKEKMKMYENEKNRAEHGMKSSKAMHEEGEMEHHKGWDKGKKKGWNGEEKPPGFFKRLGRKLGFGKKDENESEESGENV